MGELIINPAELITPEFQLQLKAFTEKWYRRYEDISHEKTPQVDATGKEIVRKKGNTGFDYIEESYMRNQLDKHFPGWTLDMAAPLHFLGAEWVVAQVMLVIVDPSLLAFGINPPVRKFYGTDSVRIQYNKGQPHTPEYIVDIGDNCKQAVTSAMKFAINRMCHIGDDIYGKRLEMDGAGTTIDVIENILELNRDASSFQAWVKERKLSWTDVLKILKITELTQITDYFEAYKKIKEDKGW